MAFRRSDLATLSYHDIFDYPLTKQDLHKWQCKHRFSYSKKLQASSNKKYYFLKGRERIVSQRIKREKYSQSKLKIAHKAAKILGKIPTIKMIGITGSVAMLNAKKGSDIDLLIVTGKDWLWTTRLLTYALLIIFDLPYRNAGESDEEDKLCLNMWIDESDLIFKQRNLYTAHEIAQIMPIVNKDKTYEGLIWQNKWILNYWPNAVSRMQNVAGNMGNKKSHSTFYMLHSTVEVVAFWIQKQYMRSKKSREVVTATRAFFHPFDWGAKVTALLYQKIK